MNIIDERPLFELFNPATQSTIKIWANGMIEGFDGVIINRFPEVLAAMFAVIGKEVIGLGNDIKNMKDLTK